MGEHSWEVVCVKYREEPEHGDCRAIAEIGYMAPTMKTRKVDSAASMIDSELSRFHIEVGGRRIPLQSAKDRKLYVRTMDEDSVDDPLLDLPTVEEYKHEERFKSKF